MRLPPEGSAHPIPREQGNDCPGSHSRALGLGGGVGAILGENLGISARSRRFSFLLSMDFLSFCWKPPPPKKFLLGILGLEGKSQSWDGIGAHSREFLGFLMWKLFLLQKKIPRKRNFPGNCKAGAWEGIFFFQVIPIFLLLMGFFLQFLDPLPAGISLRNFFP